MAAEEIENLLLRHPAVIHAALVSMEDETAGKKLRISGGKEPLRAVQVRRRFPARTGAWRNLNYRIAWVRCVTAALTPVGKVDKKQLRQRLASRS